MKIKIGSFGPNEAETIFQCSKSILQMEIIEFQEDNVFKNLYNKKCSKIESDTTIDEF